MATAKKRGDKWRILVYAGTGPDGKRKYESFTADTKKEAEFMAAEWSRQQTDRERHSGMTLRKAYEAYIESKRNVLSPSTTTEYIRLKDRHLQDLMPVRVDKITPEMVQIEINKLALNQSPKTLRNVHGLLVAVLNTYRPGLKLSTTFPTKEKKSIYVPTDADIQTLIESVRGKEIEIPILLAAFGSLRRSEIGALTADDFSGNTVTVKKAMVKNEKNEWVIKSPKTEAGYRTVELPEEVVGRLPLDRTGYLVRMIPSSYLTAFHIALEKAGLPRFRFHDLRHYQASILHALGVPDKYIIRRCGWRTDATLKNIYQHTMDDKEKEFTDKANRHFASMMQPKK